MTFVALLFHLTPLSPTPAPTSVEGWVATESEIAALHECLFAGTRACFSRKARREQSALPLCWLLAEENDHLQLRIATQDEEELPFLSTLLDALTAPAPFQFGSQRYRVQVVDPSRSAWAGFSTWADFLAPPYGATIRLRLGTPLVLPKPTEGTRCHFPAPRVLFADLARRWQECGGPSCPLDFRALLPLLEDGSIVLADYDLHATPIVLDHAVQLGFLGWISYHCRTRTPTVQTTLAALARFAFFAGIGALTERGMGAVQVTIG